MAKASAIGRRAGVGPGGNASALRMASRNGVALAAALFAFTGKRSGEVPQEAIIGIAYVVAAAAAVIMLNSSTEGDEQIKNTNSRRVVPELPLYMLNAETEASIGTALEIALRNELKRMHIGKGVCVILTHTVIDEKDRAFLRPTKPIGPLYSKNELEKAKKIVKEGMEDIIKLKVPVEAHIEVGKNWLDMADVSDIGT